MTRECKMQTYWYEGGVQRAKFCGEPAEYRVEAWDGSRWIACAGHAADAATAGARTDKLEPLKKSITQTEAPVGMVATIGHPANFRLIVKTRSGFWRHVDDGSVVNDEDFRAGWQPYLIDATTYEPIPWKE